MSIKPQKRRLLIIILLIVLLIAILAGLYFWQASRLRKARLEATNPAVYVAEPGQGFTAPSDSWITVIASSTGLRLMQSIEIWINGELSEVQNTSLESGVGVIYGHFPFLVKEGAQSFVVRAVDVDGYIGHSEPITISGIGSKEDQQSYMMVPFDPEVPLEMIANEHQIPIQQLVDLNPDIHTKTDGVIKVPVQPEEENYPVSVDQIPADLLSSKGYVNGKLCYPSQYIPAMTAYFENVATGQYASLPIALNQNSYGIALPPGTYKAYAWLPAFSLGGSYSKAVPCGLTTNCTDHAPIEFQVKTGTNTSGIDICDWYDLSRVPTTPGAPTTPSQPLIEQIASDIPMLTPEKVFPANNNGSLPFGIFLPLLPPGVPEHFAARNDECKIRIGWDTPQPPEDSYSVWLSSQSGVKLLAAKLKSSDQSSQQAWYEFTSPLSGLVSVWVDAVNVIGSTSSTVKTLQLPANCSSSSSDDLELKTLELNIGGAYDNVYLYLSAEGIPEERLPRDDSAFLEVKSGRAYLSATNKSEQVYTLPKPDDGILNITGECWGWDGDTPEKLSSFDISIPEANWNDFTKEVGNENCALDLNLTQKTDINSGVTMIGVPTFPPPTNVRSNQIKVYEGSLDPSDRWSWLWEREIRWEWPYKIKDHNIVAFGIILNGTVIKTVPANVRSTTVILPSYCGDNARWEVINIDHYGIANLSQATIEILPSCGKYAEVVFDYLDVFYSCDSCCCGKNPDDTFEAYYTLTVNGISHKVGSQNFPVPMKKGYMFFKSLGAYSNNPGHERFLVKVSKEPIEFYVIADFLDYDVFSADENWAYHAIQHKYPTFTDALNSVNNYQGTYQPIGKRYTDLALHMGLDAKTMLFYNVWFFTGK